MAPKLQATQALDGEPPSKAARRAAPEEVSERRLRAEVQALLVGADLTSITVGQLRSSLESRLGLESGALGKRKSLKKWVGRAMHHEVAKKNMRNDFCERISKALVELEDYPADTRQMLIESLPFAVPAEGPPHQHQVQLLAIVHSALGGARQQAAAQQERYRQETQAEDAQLRTFEVARDVALGAEMQVSARADAAADATRAAEKEVWLLETQVQDASRMAQELRETLANAENKRTQTVALRDGPLQSLLDGTLTKAKDREAAVSKIKSFLEEEKVETSLRASVPVALGHTPSERSAFDNLTVQSLQAVVADSISVAERHLREGSTLAADASVLAARALLEAATARVEDKVGTQAAVRAELEEASAKRKTAEAELSEQLVGAKPRLVEHDRLAARVQDIDELSCTLDGLIGGKPASEVGSGAEGGVSQFQTPRVALPTLVAAKFQSPSTSAEGSEEKALIACKVQSPGALEVLKNNQIQSPNGPVTPAKACGEADSSVYSPRPVATPMASFKVHT